MSIELTWCQENNNANCESYGFKISNKIERFEIIIQNV